MMCSIVAEEDLKVEADLCLTEGEVVAEVEIIQEVQVQMKKIHSLEACHVADLIVEKTGKKEDIFEIVSFIITSFIDSQKSNFEVDI